MNLFSKVFHKLQIKTDQREYEIHYLIYVS